MKLFYERNGNHSIPQRIPLTPVRVLRRVPSDLPRPRRIRAAAAAAAAARLLLPYRRDGRRSGPQLGLPGVKFGRPAYLLVVQAAPRPDDGDKCPYGEENERGAPSWLIN